MFVYTVGRCERAGSKEQDKDVTVLPFCDPKNFNENPQHHNSITKRTTENPSMRQTGSINKAAIWKTSPYFIPAPKQSFSIKLLNIPLPCPALLPLQLFSQIRDALPHSLCPCSPFTGHPPERCISIRCQHTTLPPSLPSVHLVLCAPKIYNHSRIDRFSSGVTSARAAPGKPFPKYPKSHIYMKGYEISIQQSSIPSTGPDCE